MVLRMVLYFNLDDLTVDDVRSVLGDLADGVCSFISHSDFNFNVHEPTSVDISCLQKSCLNCHDVEVPQCLQVMSVVTRRVW